MATIISPAQAGKPQERPVTADDLLALPPDDAARYELVEGNLRLLPPTSDEHGWSTSDLSGEIWSYVRANDLGRCWAAETGFLLARDPDTVLAPDFAFIAKDRLDYPRSGGFVPVAPDLIVETRSPSDRLTEMQDKMARWLSFGVKMALLLDPSRQTITVFTPNTTEPVTLTRDDTLDGGDILPGFTLPLRRLFAG